MLKSLGLWRRPVLLGLILGLFVSVGHAVPTVTLGPYLQLMTTNSLLIRFSSSEAAVGTIQYGVTGTGLTSSVVDSSALTTHVLTLSSLTPDTEYEYKVTMPGYTSAVRVFRTFPMPFVVGQSTPPGRTVRVWVLGDPGSGFAGELAVRDSYNTFTGTTSTDAIITDGDNAYNYGTFVEYRDKLFNVMAERFATSCLYPSMGDHDLYSADSLTQTGTYYQLFDLPTQGQAGGVPSGTEAYYSFDCGPIHFIALESMMDINTNSAQVTWLRKDLAAAKNRPWIVAYFHWTPYSMGSYNSDTAGNLTSVRQKLVPELEAGGVDLVIGGHSHNYERSCLMANHYGVSSTLTSAMQLDSSNGPYRKPAGHASKGGTVYITLGCSGEPKTRIGHHPIMKYESSVFGSGIIDANSTTLSWTFLATLGQVNDTFQIQRSNNAGVEDALTTPPDKPPGL